MFTPTTHNPHNIRRTLIHGAVLVSLFISFFVVPIAAEAQTVPTRPSKDYPFCFSITKTEPVIDPATGVGTGATTERLDSSCYPDLAACTNGQRAATDVTVPCHDAYATMSKYEKTVQEKGPIAALGEKAVEVVTGGAVGLLGTALEFIGKIGAELSGKLMMAMASVLDIAIDRTINSATYSDLAVVNVGWTAVRDMSNMFFIFVLLYISILTVLGMAGSNAKKWVVNLVVAALLINFSLFFTKVVIDAGNALSVGIWNNIKSKQGGVEYNGISSHFSEAFRIQTNFDTRGNDANGAPYPQPDAIHSAMIYFGATIVQCVTAYIFLAGAIMMIIRTVTLLVVMIVSPFAFLGFALPKGGGFASEWLSKLIGATFVAPAFIFMLDLDSTIIHSTDITSLGGGQDAKWALAFEGNPASFAIFYQYAIMVILLLGSMVVAQKVGNGVGASAGSLAKKYSRAGAGYAWNGGASIVGGSARLYEKTLGASRTLKNKTVLDAAARGDRNAIMKLANAETRAKRTYDIRNSGIGKVAGAGLAFAGVKVSSGSTSYAHQGAEKKNKEEDEEIAKAKRLFPDDPVAQEMYLKEKLGAKYGQGRHKKLEKDMTAEVKKKRAEETIENEPNNYKTLEADLASKEAQFGKGSVEYLAAETALKTSVDTLTQAMKLVGANYIKDMTLDGSPEGVKNRAFIDSDAFRKSSRAEHWKALEARDDISTSDLNDYRDKMLANKDMNPRMHENLVKQMRNEDSRYFENHKDAIKGELAGNAGNAQYVSDVTEKEALDATVGPLSPTQLARQAQLVADTAQVHKQTATRLGYMTGEQVASLDPSQLLDSSVTQGLTVPMIQEIIKTEKSTLKFGKQFFIDLKTKITNNPQANLAAKQFVDNASKNKSKDNPFAVDYGT